MISVNKIFDNNNYYYSMSAHWIGDDKYPKTGVVQSWL